MPVTHSRRKWYRATHIGQCAAHDGDADWRKNTFHLVDEKCNYRSGCRQQCTVAICDEIALTNDARRAVENRLLSHVRTGADGASGGTNVFKCVFMLKLSIAGKT